MWEKILPASMILEFGRNLHRALLYFLKGLSGQIRLTESDTIVIYDIMISVLNFIGFQCSKLVDTKFMS